MKPITNKSFNLGKLKGLNTSGVRTLPFALEHLFFTSLTIKTLPFSQLRTSGKQIRAPGFQTRRHVRFKENTRKAFYSNLRKNASSLQIVQV